MSSPRSAEAGERLRVAVLGSTGSIGTQTLDVLAAHPAAFDVVALAAGANGALLEEQAARFPSATTTLGASGEALATLATETDVDVLVAPPRAKQQRRAWRLPLASGLGRITRSDSAGEARAGGCVPFAPPADQVKLLVLPSVIYAVVVLAAVPLIVGIA